MKTAAELHDWGQRDLDSLVAYCLDLQDKLVTATQRLAIDSHNSSKPPSKDSLDKPKPKSLRGTSGKKTGGQPGHPGATLKPAKNPDHILVHPLENCPCGCGSDLSKQPTLRYESRQVFELPPQKLEVTEHRIEVKRCPLSGKLVQSVWPEGVTAPVQYGNNFLAWLVYLNAQQLVPMARIGQMSYDLYGHRVSDYTIQTAMQAVGHELAPFSEAVKNQLQQAPVVNADESGLRVAGSLHWLHVLSTTTLTWYGVHGKRGREALETFAILSAFMGRLVHDCWQTYMELPCLHALCIAHILRELVFIHEECDQVWAKSLFELLLDMNLKREEQKLLVWEFPREVLEEWHQRYRKILQEGRAVNPPIVTMPNVPKKRGRKKQTKAQNLLDRLENYEDWVLAFLHDFNIPFTNNLAEQDVRMIKVKQNISGSFRTLKGAELFATIRSYISTGRKQGRSIFQDLKAAIAGKPFIPVAPVSR